MQLVNPREYFPATKKLREFFEGRGFIEVPTQSRLSILAACEDPRTIATFNYAGNVWPLPQTGQMQLEHELLTNPDVPGYYCLSTSFREEPNPIPGRHDLIFPMFEFETHGELQDLKRLEEDLLVFLGFSPKENYVAGNYLDIAGHYGVADLTHVQEEKIAKDFGTVFFLMNFPFYTSPFWNMKRGSDEASKTLCARKIDVILYGIETIGSAERSTDPDEMRDSFNTISDGMYADILYSRFGRERVEKELNDFLNLNFFPRIGGGIGMTRMIRALKLRGLI